MPRLFCLELDRKAPVDPLDEPRTLCAGLMEHAVLTTCHRAELYCVADSVLEPPLARLREGSDAAAHLFAIACGIESQLLGETEIVAQVREAHRRAREDGSCGPAIDALFRHALSAARRARTESGISRGAASIGSAAAAVAGSRLPVGMRRRAVLVGAGAVARRVIWSLSPLGFERVDVANRSLANGQTMARPPGAAYGLEALPALLLEADLAVFATAAPAPLLSGDAISPWLECRASPLLVLDLAVPRNVDPALESHPLLEVLDLASVQGQMEAGAAARRREVPLVRQIVADEVERFEAWRRAREAAPSIARLRARVEERRQSELRRAAGGLTAKELAAADRASRAAVRALLHEPTVALRSGDSASAALLVGDGVSRRRIGSHPKGKGGP